MFGSVLPDGRVLIGVGETHRLRRPAPALSSVRPLIVGPTTPTPTPGATLPVGTAGAKVTASVPASVVGGAKARASAAVTVSAPAERA